MENEEEEREERMEGHLGHQQCPHTKSHRPSATANVHDHWGQVPPSLLVLQQVHVQTVSLIGAIADLQRSHSLPPGLLSPSLGQVDLHDAKFYRTINKSLIFEESELWESERMRAGESSWWSTSSQRQMCWWEWRKRKCKTPARAICV